MEIWVHNGSSSTQTEMSWMLLQSEKLRDFFSSGVIAFLVETYSEQLLAIISLIHDATTPFWEGSLAISVIAAIKGTFS